MRRKVVLIGPLSDFTMSYTAEVLVKHKVAFDFIDTPTLISNGALSYNPQKGLVEITARSKTHVLDQNTNLFYRQMDVSPAAPSEELKQRAIAIQSHLSLGINCLQGTVLNKPIAMRYNTSKLFHMATTTLKHIKMPPSLCSTCPDEVRIFFEKHDGKVIVKGSSSFKTKAALVSKDDFEKRMHLLPQSPPLFQRQIEGIELRVHCVGSQAFAEIIAARDVDYRFLRNRRHIATLNYELDAVLLDEVRSIVNQLGLGFAGIDLKFDEKSGNWYFLEANPMPCYHGYDFRSKGQISNALVERLVS